MAKKQPLVLPTRKCMYCLVEKKSNEFNKEHVLPQLMGMYENGLTIKSVCNDCNSYFGRYVDPVFAEDTYEAILRTSSGIKHPDAIDALRWERVNIAIPPGGWWAGARLKLSYDGKAMQAQPLPQIGFLRKSTGAYEYFTRKELDEIDDWADLGNKDFKIISSTETQESDLKAFCESKFGAETTYMAHFEPPPAVNGEIEVEIESRIDDLVKRAVCKIAFNYLAKVIAADRREMLLGKVFDDIRFYARAERALSPDRLTVQVGNEHSVLKLPANVGIHAHVIVLEYDSDGALHCRFSPYDHFHYEVLLAKSVQRIVDPTGHIFYYRETPKRCEALGVRAPEVMPS